MYACDETLFRHARRRAGVKLRAPVRLPAAAAVTRKGSSRACNMDNIDTLLERERGLALDYAEMQKLKLQEEKPDDFVLAATGGQ